MKASHYTNETQTQASCLSAKSIPTYQTRLKEMSAAVMKSASLQRSVRAGRRVSVRASSEKPLPPSTPATPPPRVFTDKQLANAVSEASSPVAASATAVKAVTIGDAMAFSGPAPETVNGRLAMLGFLSAVGAEVSSGESVLRQLGDAPVAIGATFLAFALASLVPILKGANLKEAFGPFTPTAEMLNGRMAMLGLVGLATVEIVKGSAPF